jgi:hypothetical protein
MLNVVKRESRDESDGMYYFSYGGEASVVVSLGSI